MPPASFPTLQLLIALVESAVPCPIHIAHAVWFSPTGAVEGHFYMSEKRTSLASSALHFSVCWPPSDAPSTERGENQLTRRRRQRRAVFEAFTGSAQDSSSQTASSSFRGLSVEPRSQDIVAVLVHPPTAQGGRATLVDYLDAKRLQQFCDLPPAEVTDSTDLNAGGQEAILLRFPQTLSASYRFTASYISCHGLTGTVATELHEADTPMCDIDAPIQQRTDTTRPLRISGGTRRRLGLIGQTCCGSFPSNWWQASNKQRLGMFCLVEYNTSVHHVERFTLLCAIAAPMPPSVQTSHLSSTRQTLHANGSASTRTAQQHEVHQGSPTGRKSEDISWTLDEDRAHPGPNPEGGGATPDSRSPPKHQRWTFVRQPHDGHLASTSGASPFAPKPSERRTKQMSPQPGGSFAHATGAVSVPPKREGRYTADGDATNNVSNHPWQRYNLQRYDVEGAPETGSALALAHPEPTPVAPASVPERELLQEQYIEGLRDGSLFGYLVDATLPIGRDPHIVSLHARREDDDDAHCGIIPEVLSEADRLRLASNAPSDAYQSCLSSQTLRHLRETQLRNPMVTKTADPFVRIRRGLLPAMARGSRKPHTNKHAAATVPVAIGAPPATNASEGTLAMATPPDRPTITICESAEWQPPERHLQQSTGGGAPAPSVLHAVLFRKTFLDRFVEAVDAVEAMPRRSDNGSLNATVESEQSLPSAAATIRRPPGQVGFSFASGSMLAATPLSRSAVGGCGDASGGAPLTPRRLLLESMRMEAVKQCWEDMFYAIYSQHGGPPMAQPRAQSREMPHVSVVRVRLATRVDVSEALEHVYWLHALNPSLGSISVLVHDESNSKASEDQSGDAECETAAGEGGVGSEKETVMLVDVALQVVNAYAAIALVKSRLEQQSSSIEAFLRREECNAQVLTAQRKQQRLEREVLVGTLREHVRKHRECLATTSATAPSPEAPTSPQKQQRRASHGGDKAAGQHVEQRPELDVTQLFTEAAPRLSVCALCVEEMGPDFPLHR